MTKASDNPSQKTSQSWLQRLAAKFGFDQISWPVSPPEHVVKKDTLLFISLLMLAPVLVHFFIGSSIIASIAAFVVAIKAFVIITNRKQVSKYIVISLALLSLASTIVLYSGWNTQTAGISFLIVLLALKFLEAQRLRDYFMTCILLYFVAACSFLYFTGPLDMLLVTVFCCAVTAALIKLTSQDNIQWRSLLGNSTGILFKALPIAILLFFFFPRINANIGFLPTPQQQNQQSQLQNQLDAQEFSESAFSDELAFRVEFNGRVPAQNQLYWRSKVMTIENNFSWQLTPKEQIEIRSQAPRYRPQIDASSTYQYTVLHQASKDNYIPYLDYPIKQDKGFQLNDFSAAVRSPSPINFIYSGESITSPLPINNFSDFEQRFTQLSAEPSARLQRLMNQWKFETNNNPKQLADKALNYFRNQEFSYSLLPPELGNNPLDEFLFDSRVGYCAHYASAYTSMMRWLGIPARVVVGYQGGEFNSSGNYLEVRYSDAHAWSEIWIDNQWRRIDPTAVIRPERIEFGMEALLNLLGRQDTRGLSRSALADSVVPQGFDRMLKKFTDSFSNFGYQWSKWVVNYDADRQKELLAKLGLNPQNTTLFLSIVVIAIIAIFSLLLFLMMRPVQLSYSPLQKEYLRFIRKLEGKTLTKAPSESPLSFAERAYAHYPNKANDIEKIISAYIGLRYKKSTKLSHRDFRKMVRQFKA